MKASSSSRNEGQDAVTIELIGTLGYHAGKRELDIRIQGPMTITTLVKKLEEENEIPRGTLTDDSGAQARRDLLILVNGREISVLDGLATLVKGGDRVTLLPVSHGG